VGATSDLPNDVDVLWRYFFFAQSRFSSTIWAASEYAAAAITNFARSSRSQDARFKAAMLSAAFFLNSSASSFGVTWGLLSGVGKRAGLVPPTFHRMGSKDQPSRTADLGELPWATGRLSSTI
jgi:hypothetical protein